MKKIFLPVVAATALLFTACGAEEAPADDTTQEDTTPAEPVAATYSVDGNASTLAWKGTDLAAPADHYHSGTVAVCCGTINTEDGKIVSGEVNVDLTQLGYTEGNSGGPMTSADTSAYMGLFDHLGGILMTAENGTAKFTITGCDDSGIQGTLNVMGVDVPVTVPGMPTVDENSISHSADWFDVDMTPAGGLFVPNKKDDGSPGMQVGLSMKLDLTANK